MRKIKIVYTPMEGAKYPLVSEDTMYITHDQMKQIARKELMFNDDYSALIEYGEPRIDTVAEIKYLIHEYKRWFEFYDNQVAEYLRCQRMGIAYDNRYGTIEELDAEAVEKAAYLKKYEALA